MNFLEICQEVARMAGTQGSFSSVSDPVGAHAVIVSAVVAAFRDIQTDRNNWEWMLKSKEYAVDAGFGTYTTATIFGSQDDTATVYLTFGRWDKLNPGTSCYATHPTTSKVTNVKYMDYYQYREYYKNSDATITGTPDTYTVHPLNNSIIFKPLPDVAYAMTVSYYVKPLLLTENAQVPYLPIEHHNCIVYKALERVANHYSNMAIYDKYAGEAAIALGQLYRSYIPAQSVQINPIA